MCIRCVPDAYPAYQMCSVRNNMMRTRCVPDACQMSMMHTSLLLAYYKRNTCVPDKYQMRIMCNREVRVRCVPDNCVPNVYHVYQMCIVRNSMMRTRYVSDVYRMRNTCVPARLGALRAGKSPENGAEES
jgi:hypothetical protein